MKKRKILRFLADAELLSMAYDRKIYLMTTEAEKKEIKETSLRKGLEEGLKKGHALACLEGKKNTILEISHEMYPDHDCLWIKDLDEVQLSYVLRLLCKQLSYEDFYQSVIQFVH